MPPDLLLIICDTARADAFRPWGSPHPTPVVERLAREGTVYRKATSQAPWTLPSTASILSGALPTEHGISGNCLAWKDGAPSSPKEAVKAYAGAWLPELLRERGYRTFGTSCNRWVSIWGGFDRGFDAWHDARAWTRVAGVKAGSTVRRARRVLGNSDRGGREAADAFARRLSQAGTEPLFALVNLMECHAPYDPPPRFHPSFGSRGDRSVGYKRLATLRYQVQQRKFLRRPNPDYVASVRALYYGSAKYEDHLLGRIVEAVEERGRPTVVIVTSDHGENLGDHGLFAHNSSLHQSLLHVPLVVWGQKVGMAGGSADAPVSLLGLSGWLASVADGANMPFAGNGTIVSEYESTRLQMSIPPDIRRRMRVEGEASVPALVNHPGMAARTGSLKYVAVANGDEALYDLSADPTEERNVIGARPDDAANFRALRDAWEHRRSTQPAYDQGDVAEGEIADHLRDLGYIE